MGKVPVDVFNHYPSADNKNGLVSRSENPVLAKVMEERRHHFRRPQDQDPSLLERIALESRVLIVEGISGSGKDTFQKYLKSKLRGRVVHDYSEGELLLSWNQRPIKDIFKLQVRLMRNFINYVADTLSRDNEAVFLLNRFHLSTYTMGVTEQPKLEREYNVILKTLRTLPTHVFVLQLRENEIESRSSHPERGAAWHKFQQHILEREGFQNFVKAKRFAAESDGRNSDTSTNSFLNSQIAIGNLTRRLPNVAHLFWTLPKISMQVWTHEP